MTGSRKQLVERYFNIIRRWIWLILLSILAATITTYWTEKQQLPVYEAKAQLIIGPGIDSFNPELNALRTGGQLMQTYAELATMQPVLQMVIDDLGLKTTPGKLENGIEVKLNQDAQILTINVQDENQGDRAVTIANALAEVLVRLSPANTDSPQAKLLDEMRTQAAGLKENIATIEATITQLETDFQATTDTKEQRLIMERISEERGRLTEGQRTLALLYDTLQEASTNQIKIVEPATNARRIGSQFELKMLISVIAGLTLGLVIALAFEYFDSTIKTAEELVQVSNITLLGTISKRKSLSNAHRERLIVRALPMSPAAEHYRLLGAKLLSTFQFKPGSKRALTESEDGPDIEPLPPSQANPLRSILISSLHLKDNVGEIAANLAVVLAQTGQRVILVDAYLQHPTIDQLFGVPNRGGLTTILTAGSKTPELISVDWAAGLSILPGGPVPPNPFELLASPRMADLIKQMENLADIIIIVASPLLSFGDGLMLASHVDGVMIVAPKGKTQRDMIREVTENLRLLKVHLLGAIFDYNGPRRWKKLSEQVMTLGPQKEKRWRGAARSFGIRFARKG